MYRAIVRPFFGFIQSGKTSSRFARRSRWAITSSYGCIRRGSCILKTNTSKSYHGNLFKYFCSDSKFPSHHRVPLPALSPTMEKGTIVSWEKKEGDKLNEGDLLAEIETDKATMGFETPEEGYLAKILVPAGTKDVPLGRLLCIIVSSEGDIAAFKNFVDLNEGEVSAPSRPVSPPKPTIEITDQPVKSSLPSPPQQQYSTSDQVQQPVLAASPLARKIATEKGIDLSGIQGSGPGGRIRAQDIEAISSSGIIPKSSSVAMAQDIPISSMRQVIAGRLQQSKQTVPHYYLSTSINMRKISEIRSKFNSTFKSEDERLSVNDFVLKAAALACKKVPESNSSWQDGFIRQYNKVNINIAVNTDAGLITPVISDVDRKGLSSISKETKTLALKAKERKLRPEELQGGTFTLSNLGMFGVRNFSAIINPPQACILAVGTIVETCVPERGTDLGYTLGSMMDVTLSCDHRVIDGAVGAQWLMQFKNFLEMPESMLL